MKDKPEMEIARWFKSLRKGGSHLTQKELSERTGIPLSTIRHFEQSGQIGFQAFLRIAAELHILESFLALARNEEPETFHKVQKEKTILRLRDELQLATGQSTPRQIRQRNSAVDPAQMEKLSRWRLAGRTRWNPAKNAETGEPVHEGRKSHAR